MKPACLLFIPEFALSLLSGGKDFGSDRQGMDEGQLAQVLAAQAIWGACGSPTTSALTFLPGDSIMLLITVMELLVTSGQGPGTVPGPSVCISFNLNPVR